MDKLEIRKALDRALDTAMLNYGESNQFTYFSALEKAFELGSINDLINLLKDEKSIDPAFLPLLAELITKYSNKGTAHSKGLKQRFTFSEKNYIHFKIQHLIANEKISKTMAVQALAEEFNADNRNIERKYKEVENYWNNLGLKSTTTQELKKRQK